MTTIALHVTELRPGSRSGPPIVCLHGFMGCAEDFSALVAAEEFPDRRVLALDLPGHGQSPNFDSPWSFEDVVESILVSLQLDQPFDLIGYSMGGRIALYLAGTNPHRVSSLMLIGAHPGIEHPREQRDRLETDHARAALLVEHPEIFVDEWGQLDLFGEATSPAWVEARTRRAKSAPEHGYGWSRALLSLSTGRQLMLWNVPYMTEKRTLFVAGAHDDKYLDVGRELIAQNPDVVSMAIVVNAHHAPHLDRPDAVAKRIAAWLE